MTRPTFTVAAATRLGDRDVNEDVFAVDEAAGLVLVADGFGGGHTGRLAATRAVEAALAAVREKLADGVTVDRSIGDAFARAHEAVKEAMRGREPAGGTALCLGLVHGHRLTIGNHGDTQAFRVRAGQLQRLTSDPSVYLTAVEAPKSGADPGFSPTLGHDEGFRAGPEIVRSVVRAGDVVLLCSDGCWYGVGERRIVATAASVGTLAAAADALVDRATEGTGADNATVILLRIGA